MLGDAWSAIRARAQRNCSTTISGSCKSHMAEFLSGSGCRQFRHIFLDASGNDFVDPVCSQSWALVFAVADAVGPVQEELPVAKGGLSILIDRDDDGLDVMVAPALAGRPDPDLGQAFYPRRVIVALVVLLGTLGHHDRPPKTRPLTGGCSFLSRSRSAHRSSILLSIRSKSASAEAVEIPAR